jgi:hypothetical protein
MNCWPWRVPTWVRKRIVPALRRQLGDADRAVEVAELLEAGPGALGQPQPQHDEDEADDGDQPQVHRIEHPPSRR